MSDIKKNADFIVCSIRQEDKQFYKHRNVWKLRSFCISQVCPQKCLKTQI